MNREDELIREALHLDVCPSEELNRKILQSAEEKRRPNRSALRTLATVAAIIIVLLGTATAVNAATGGKITEFIKEKFHKLTYVFENGSHTERELVEGPDGEWVEKVTFVEDNVTMYIEMSSEVISYDLLLKIISEQYGHQYDNFVHLRTFLHKGDPEEALYYEIRGGFRRMLLNPDFRQEKEKTQVLAALREAAQHADRDPVKNGLLDLAADLEGNRRMFYDRVLWGADESDGWDIFLEDLSEIPAGEAAIVVTSLNGTQSRVYLGAITETTMEWTSSWFYTEDRVRSLRNDGIPVYDLRKTK